MAQRYDYTHAERKEKILRILVSVAIWMASVLGVIALAYGVISFSLEKTTLVDASMDPTLMLGDEILIDTFTYRFRDPKRYEVIVFQQGDEEHSFYNIKRVIGLPGETVQIIGGYVFIDGEKLEETVNVDAMLLPGLANYEIKLEDNEYFVLGDARNNAEDSRYATVDNVLAEDIVGRAWIRLNQFGMINGMNRKQ